MAGDDVSALGPAVMATQLHNIDSLSHKRERVRRLAEVHQHWLSTAGGIDAIWTLHFFSIFQLNGRRGASRTGGCGQKTTGDADGDERPINIFFVANL